MTLSLRRKQTRGNRVLPYTPADLLHLARHIRGERVDVRRLSPKVREAFATELGLQKSRGVPLCYAPIFRFLSRVTAGKAVAASVRQQVSSILFPRRAARAIGTLKQGLSAPDYSTPHFDFFYNAPGGPTVRDMHVPPPRHVTLWNSTEVVGTLSAPGIPDYVQVISLLLEYWYQRFMAAGFRDPCQTSSIQVDFTTDIGGALGLGGSGNIFLRADLTDAQIHEAPAHELFHCIEDMYCAVSGPSGQLPNENETSWSEGCTYMIADLYDPLVNRWMELFNYYVRYVRSRPLTTITGATSFWRYASEKCTAMNSAADRGYGADVIRRCWGFAAKGEGLTLPSLRRAIDAVAPEHTRFIDFEFAPTGELRSNEVLYGNFLVANLTKDLAGPISDFRFDYLQNREAPGLQEMGALPLQVRLGVTSGWTAYDLDAWSCACYYCVPIGGAQDTRIDFELNSGSGSLLQVVLCSDGPGEIVDIVRSRGGSFSRVFGTRGRLIDRMYVVVASTDTALNYRLQVTGVAPAPDLMISTWDAVPGCEYQQDPKTKPWTGVSPDIWVEANGHKDRFHPPDSGGVAKLFVRVRNKGAADATNVQVKLYHGLQTDSWNPVRSGPESDPQTHDQILTIPKVGANSEVVASVDWYLPVPPVNREYAWRPVNCRLKAEIVSGDASLENNVACRTGVVVSQYVRRPKRSNARTKPRKPKHPKEMGRRKTSVKRGRSMKRARRSVKRVRKSLSGLFVLSP